jgi:PadR family transcriptional regulator PadR
MGERTIPELLPGTLYMLIKESSREDLIIEDGSLYPALNRMLVKGWLKAEWGISENNRKARFYQLTPEGRQQLDQESEDFDRLVRAIQLVMRTA